MSEPDRDDLPPGIEEVDRAYRAAGFDDLPPKRIDELVLAAARQHGRRKTRAYLPALAAAATVVLALGLVLRLTLPGPNGGQPQGESITDVAPAVEDGPQPDAADVSTLSTEAGVRTRSAPSMLPEAAREAGDAPACSAAQRAEADPWIECISALVERDALSQARSELAEFARRFPGRELPAELSDALTR